MGSYYQVHVRREATNVDHEPAGLAPWESLAYVRSPRTEAEALHQARELRKVYVNVRVVKYATKEEVIYQ